MESEYSNGTLWCIFVLFAAPLVCAIYFFYFDHQPLPSKQHGQLVKVAQPFPIEAIQMPQREFVKGFKGKWTLALIYPKYCRLSCQRYENLLSRIIRATNENSRRLQQVTMISGAKKTEQHDAFKLYLSPDNALKTILNLNASHAQLLIIDPLSLMVMHYDRLGNGEKILKDMKHLLRASHIG